MRKKENKLPRLPQSSDVDSVDYSYAELGAVFLLDANCDSGMQDHAIAECYSFFQSHFRQNTCFLALTNDRRPLGYMTWKKPFDRSSDVTLLRECAPFGEYHSLLCQWNNYYSLTGERSL